MHFITIESVDIIYDTLGIILGFIWSSFFNICLSHQDSCRKNCAISIPGADFVVLSLQDIILYSNVYREYKFQSNNGILFSRGNHSINRTHFHTLAAFNHLICFWLHIAPDEISIMLIKTLR